MYVKVGGKNIHQLLCMTVTQLRDFFRNVQLSEKEHLMADKAIEEIDSRLK